VTYEKTQENILNERAIVQDNILNFEFEKIFRPQPVTVDIVVLTFKGLRETNAVGADDIAFQFIRDSLPVTAFYLTIAINTSIVTGQYPQLWKHSIIVPTFKAGDVQDPSNFRPISLLPILSKILEKIVSNQLMEFMEGNHLFSNTQHGFSQPFKS